MKLNKPNWITLVTLITLSVTACKSDKKNNTTSITNTLEAKQDTTRIPVNPNKDVFFGEIHLHSAYSLDAYIGGTRIRPEDSYRFAKGEELLSQGKPIKLKRPLDFCAVTDHAEYIGEMYSMMTPDAPGYDHEAATAIRNAKTYKEAMTLFVKYVAGNNRSANPKHPEFYQGEATTVSGWNEIQDAAEAHYEPGTFTTFHAFEWTAAPNGGNLHRNIIFRTSNATDMPISAYEIPREEALWEWLRKEREAGHDVLAIPHNSNASKGMMFNEVDSKGDPLTVDYMRTRQEFEPLIEMMQIKGNSEVVPRFWPNDEFANFENATTMENYSDRKYMKKNFVRYGLKKGLDYEAQTGVNPYKYGFVGGTDNHNGLPGNVEEDNYKVGSHGLVDLTAESRAKNSIDGWAEAYDINPGSLTAVWAEANTREHLWDAMNSKEVYATSGPRIKVRFFGGYDLDTNLDDYKTWVQNAYTSGVTMGSDLPVNTSESPKFIVWAAKDPMGPNLDRIQIIKGWVEKGEMQEKIYNVAVSDNRKIAADGSVASVDAPVDLQTGAFNTDKGSPELKAVWTDPDFNPEQHAFYYLRVLQLPTARWTLWDEIREGVSYPESVPKTIIERAWSSPIWYNPN